MAPQYANFFMSKLETEFLETCTLQPVLYSRYIDDIFFLWPHGEQALLDFHSRFNDFHSTINLTMNYSRESINFLDTTIMIKDDRIHTSLYRKPTDKLSLLNFSSFHPTHTRESIPYSQALRYHRICDDADDRDQHLGELRKALVHQGYNPHLVSQQFRRAVRQDRNFLLHNKRDHSTKSNRVPLVVTYHPHLNRLRNIIRELQHIFDSDPHLSRIFPEPPILSFRQPANLRSILVPSRLPHGGGAIVSYSHSTRPCNRPRCMTCPLISSDVSISRGNVTFNFFDSFDCTTSHVVYLIRCRRGCSNAWYIGETKNALSVRINGHRTTIKHPKPHFPVGVHFSLEDHSASDMIVNVLVGNQYDIHRRKMTEMKMIHKFDTHNNGLNKDCGFMSHYVLSQ